MKLMIVNFGVMLGFISASLFGGNLPVTDDIIFRNGVVENLYPKYVLFRVEICGRSSTSYVIFNFISHVSGVWEKETKTLNEGKTGYGCYKYKYFLETQNRYIPPFFEIEYFWSVTEGKKVVGQSSKNVYTYKNEAYAWKNLKDEHLVVWWHDRPDSFGQEVMTVATLAFKDQMKFYSFSLAAPITIVIMNTSDEFYGWQPQKNSMITGQAFSKSSLTIQLVEDNVAYHDLLNGIIPHEISHVYFGHLVKENSEAPIWLNEGLAVYNEYSSHWDKWVTLKAAHERGETLDLKNLDNIFGKESEKLELAYAESYYTVLYMDEVYGEHSITTLVDEYSKGTAMTNAFEKSFGKDPAEFEKDFVLWLDERLETPPPNTARPEPLLSQRTAIGFVFVGVACVVVLFSMMLGGFLIVGLIVLNLNSLKKAGKR